MLINKKAKVERVLKDSDRDDAALVVYAGGEDGVLPSFDKEFGRVTALGGRVIVSVPCTMEADDVPGPMPGEAMTYARQHTEMPVGKTSAHLMLDSTRICADNGTVFVRKGAEGEGEGMRLVSKEGETLVFELSPGKAAEPTESLLREDGTYKVGPTLDMLRGTLVSSAVRATVRLNPALLTVLADAMGSATAVKLTIYEDAHVVRVDVGDECELQGAFGYLATIRGTGE
jgi:hypothetical protein